MSMLCSLAALDEQVEQDDLTFGLFSLSFACRAERPHAERVWQESQLHDDVAESVAQRPPQFVAQLQGADVALLPDVKPHIQLWLCWKTSRHNPVDSAHNKGGSAAI